MFPSVGLMRQEHNFKNVLLPLPEGPTMETKSPFSTSTDIFFNIVLPSLIYDTFSNLSKDNIVHLISNNFTCLYDYTTKLKSGK